MTDDAVELFFNVLPGCGFTVTFNMNSCARYHIIGPISYDEAVGYGLEPDSVSIPASPSKPSNPSSHSNPSKAA